MENNNNKSDSIISTDPLEEMEVQNENNSNEIIFMELLDEVNNTEQLNKFDSIFVNSLKVKAIKELFKEMDSEFVDLTKGKLGTISEFIISSVRVHIMKSGYEMPFLLALKNAFTDYNILLQESKLQPKHKFYGMFNKLREELHEAVNYHEDKSLLSVNKLAFLQCLETLYKTYKSVTENSYNVEDDTHVKYATMNTWLNTLAKNHINFKTLDSDDLFSTLVLTVSANEYGELPLPFTNLSINMTAVKLRHSSNHSLFELDKKLNKELFDRAFNLPM